ncbi:PAS domain S-box protein [Persicobacter sp. CCB-QB2]|uniref:PAS domain S-box protein n=1 Tax=Persicobacter sp. CCB-QB2 TaxID=1561025 RepID=UPI0006A98F59|nr:PAS domain S-box protein [Persicobacter sp. CCB-QB2]
MLGNRNDLLQKSKEELIEEILRMQKDSSSQARLLVKESPKAAMIISMEGDLIAANTPCLNFFGLDSQEQIAENPLFLHILAQEVEGAPIFQNIEAQGLSGGLTLQIPFQPTTGEEISVLASLSIVRISQTKMIFLKLSRETKKDSLDLPISAVMTRMTNEYHNLYYFDENWRAFSGIPENKLIDEWIDLIHPDDYSFVFSKIQNAHRRKISYRIEYRLKNQEGKYITVQETGIPRYPHKTSFNGFIVATVPIKLTSDNTSKINPARTGAPFIVTVTLDGFILSCNQSFAELFHLLPQQLFGRKISNFLNPKKGNPKSSFKDNFFPKDLEEFDAVKCLTKNKDFNPLELNFYRVPGKITNRSNLITLVGGVDPEEEKTDRKGQLLHYQSFDKISEMVAFMKIDGEFSYVNETFCKRMRMSEKEILEATLLEVIAQDQLTELKHHLEQFLVLGIPEMDLPLEFIKGDNSSEVLKGTFIAIKEKDEVTAIQLIINSFDSSYLLNKTQEIYSGLPSWVSYLQSSPKWFSRINEALKTIVFYDFCALKILQPKANQEAYHEWQEDQLYSPVQLQEEVFEKLSTLASPSIINEQSLQNFSVSDPTVKDLLYMPLFWNGELIGQWIFLHRNPRTNYGFQETLLIDIVAPAISEAISGQRLKGQQHQEKNREQSIICLANLNPKAEIISVNGNYEAYAELMGNAFQIGEKCPEADHEATRDIFTQHWQEVTAGKPMAFEFRHAQKKGNKMRWFRIAFLPCVENEQAEKIIMSIQDISVETHQLFMLEANESKYRKIYERSPDLYFRCNIMGKITMISPSALDIMGYNPEEIIGKNIGDYYLYKGAARKFSEALAQSKRLSNVQVHIIHKSGKTVPCFLHLRHADNKKGPLELEGFIRDMTELEHTQKELKKTIKAKDSFLANMSHEIRTPMNGIIGMIDLLGHTPLLEEQADYVDALRKSSETLMEILNDILDLSKIQAGKMRLRKTPIKIRETLEKLHNLFKPQTDNHDISFDLLVDNNVPEVVMLDETRLLQVLSNLTSNAIKFTEPKGFINIYLKVEKQTDDVFLFRTEVKDSGIGISPASQQTLFNAFEQGDHSTSKPFSGAGLGLAICQKLCRLMNGEIHLNSTLGLGSTFWFTFEAELPDEDQIPIVKESKPKLIRNTFSPKEQPKILLVDDNFINRKVAGEILSKAGCAVTTANSGEEAISKVQQMPFDLVFMDIQMPGKDGIQTTKEIKALGLEFCPPIVAMTAYAMSDDKKRFLEEGLDDYLAKPIRAQEIIKKVQEHTHSLAQKETVETKKETNSTPVINKAIVDQLYDIGGCDLIDEVYQNFDLESSDLIQEAKNFALKKDYENILRNLHTLKGNAATLGIEQLAEKVKATEQELKIAPYDNLENDLDKIGKLFDIFKTEYKNFLKTYKLR